MSVWLTVWGLCPIVWETSGLSSLQLLIGLIFILVLVRERCDAITYYINKANLASTPRPTPPKGEFKDKARRLAVATGKDCRGKAGAAGPFHRPQPSYLPAATMHVPRLSSCPLNTSFTQIAEYL